MKTKYPYQPKTGQRCSCKPGKHRDNCPTCEGTGWVIDFRAIREHRTERQKDVARVQECLDWLAAGNLANPAWILDLHREARQLGLLPPPQPQVGCACRPGIDRGIDYGGDREDVF